MPPRLAGSASQGLPGRGRGVRGRYGRPAGGSRRARLLRGRKGVSRTGAPSCRLGQTSGWRRAAYSLPIAHPCRRRQEWPAADFCFEGCPTPGDCRGPPHAFPCTVRGRVSCEDDVLDPPRPLARAFSRIDRDWRPFDEGSALSATHVTQGVLGDETPPVYPVLASQSFFPFRFSSNSTPAGKEREHAATASVLLQRVWASSVSGLRNCTNPVSRIAPGRRHLRDPGHGCTV